MAQVIIDYDEYQELLELKKLKGKVDSLESRRVLSDSVMNMCKTMNIEIKEKDLLNVMGMPKNVDGNTIELHLKKGE